MDWIKKLFGINKPAQSNKLQQATYEESCIRLQEQHIISRGAIPPMPVRMPRHDDEEPLGVEFFRAQLADADLASMTLPRTFFGRSKIQSVSFRNTDLSESTANWNDFNDVDFSGTDLSRCDFRGCIFQRVKFAGAILRDADFRHSSFQNCDFTSADMHGLKMTKTSAVGIQLNSKQLNAIAWQTNEGHKPEGG